MLVLNALTQYCQLTKFFENWSILKHTHALENANFAREESKTDSLCLEKNKLQMKYGISAAKTFAENFPRARKGVVQSGP